MSLVISECPGKRARLAAEHSARKPRSPPRRAHRGPGAPHAEARRGQRAPGSPAQPPPSLAPGARGRAAARPLTSAAGAPGRGPLAGNARPSATPPGTAFPPETAAGGARRWVGPGARGAWQGRGQEGWGPRGAGPNGGGRFSSRSQLGSPPSGALRAQCWSPPCAVDVFVSCAPSGHRSGAPATCCRALRTAGTQEIPYSLMMNK